MGDTERKNVIVVGAGASQEFGLPTGAELTKKLRLELQFNADEFGSVTGRFGNQDLRSALQSYAFKEKLDSRLIFDVARKISDNMELAPSIDNFLDTHRENKMLVDVGKIAIANSIMQAEAQSKLRIDDTNIYNRLNFADVEQSWAAVFFKLVAAKRDFENFLLALESITFISFNYDRCIKQFFVNAAASYFDLDGRQTETVLSAIDVIHPCGSIGELSVSNRRTQNFGRERDSEHVLQAARNIRTFTEGVSERELLAGISTAMAEAEILIFLGFSFIDINMEIIAPANSKSGDLKRILATAKGRSLDTKTRLAKQLAKSYLHTSATDRIEMFDGKCFELFWEYDHFLMSAQPN